MDSYSSFRDSSARSPSDRGWNGRDDSRTKDERSDSFYRGRSPGRNGRDRRRSRSPAAAGVDRYEPRRGGRDEYAGTRDRDDRSRRVGSPPANIDRYVPGQDAAPQQPTVNLLQDPVKLPYQVGFSYFGEWWRLNEKIKEEKERTRTGRRREADRVKGPREAAEEREKEKAKIQEAYDAYKEELQSKMARTFVGEHKKEQWFRERYVPGIRDAFREQINEIRKGAYSQWEQDLESGTFDEFSLEGLPKNESNGTGGMVEKEEGEATASNEILGVGDLIPASGIDLRDEALLTPTLLIKTIAPHVSRQNLEAFCREHLGEEEGGFKWLSLSDPNPSKRYHRIGWVMLHPAAEVLVPVDRADPKDEEDEKLPKSPVLISTAEKALDAINGKTVKDEVRGDFVCHVGVHNPPLHPRKKALWDLFSAPERIERDLELVQRLVNRFETPFGAEFKAIPMIDERVEMLKGTGRLQPAAALSPTKKEAKERRLLGLDEAMDEGQELEMDDDDEEEGAVDEDEADDEDLLVKKKQLDLLIEYLRRVFNFCFFCVFESDSVHELTRKCPGGHLRRPKATLSSSAKAVAKASAAGDPFPGRKKSEVVEEEGEAAEAPEKKYRTNKAEQQLLRAYNWVKTFEDKIRQLLEPEAVDIRKLGGKLIEDALNEELVQFVKQEDEHKWRCRVPDCTKLFKEDHFWRKHVEKRHAEWLESQKQEFELINAYVLDPSHIAPSRTDANSNGHFPPGNGPNPTGTPRGFNLQNFALNTMMPLPGFPMPPGGFPPMFAAGGPPMGWTVPEDNNNNNNRGGPIRRGGMGGNRGGGGGYRSNPYDRRQNPRWENSANMGGGRGGRSSLLSGAGRWGDGAAGGAAVGPREAVQGRSLKSYEDLDHAAGGGGGELNY